MFRTLDPFKVETGGVIQVNKRSLISEEIKETARVSCTRQSKKKIHLEVCCLSHFFICLFVIFGIQYYSEFQGFRS